MSAINTAKKTEDEIYLELLDEYRAENPGAVRTKAFAKWIANNKKIPDPTVDVVKLHEEKAKKACRRKRIHDLKGRKIKPWVAAKIERMTANGQKLFETVVDHLHEMSLDHALSAFGQRDELITKQRLAASRDLESCLDFNPNVAGHKQQFVFAFMDDEPGKPASETISESPTSPGYPPAKPR